MISIHCKMKRLATACRVRLKRLVTKTYVLDVAIIGKRDVSIRKIVCVILSANNSNSDIRQFISSPNSSMISKDPTVIKNLIRMNNLKPSLLHVAVRRGVWFISFRYPTLRRWGHRYAHCYPPRNLCSRAIHRPHQHAWWRNVFSTDDMDWGVHLAASMLRDQIKQKLIWVK